VIPFEVSIFVRRSTKDVFEFIADSRNMSKWSLAVVEVRKVFEGSVGLGTKYWMARELPSGRAENAFEIIEYEPEKKLTVKITSRVTPFVYHYRFEPVENGTMFSVTAQAEKKGLVEVLGAKTRIAPESLFASFVKRDVEENFKTPKNLMESSG
jgi:Polyketide cyclase / dehydrase and lipid transport